MWDPVYITVVLLPVFLCPSRVGGASIPSAQELDLEALTQFDLANLPMDNNTYTIPRRSNPDLQCKSFRSKMQISDGFCTSIKPVSSVLCTGSCLPSVDLPWYAMSLKFWGRAKVVEYRCEDDVIKRKKVQLLCENGQTRTIEVKVVRSCVCTRYVKDQNRPLHQQTPVSESQHNDRKNSRGRRKHRNRDNTKRRKDRRKDRRRKSERRNKKKSTPNRTPSEL